MTRSDNLNRKESDMATAAIELPLDEAGTDIAIIVERDHSVVLFDQEKFDAWYDKLKADAPKDADVGTNKGREALRSYSAGIRKQKAAIDRDRLRLTSEWRAMTAKVNEAGKQIETRLDALADEVRQPLTDWESAEKARVAKCREIIDGFKRDGVVTIEDTADSVRDRGTAVWQTALDHEQFGDMLAEAEAAKAQAVEVLKAALARLTQEEADRAELERLRAEAAEREAREQAEREAREADERAAAEAQAAEERRIAAEKAEAERVERLQREAEGRARREAEEAAEAERQRIRREHDEQLAAERRRAEEAERAAQAERDRIAAEEAARAAEAQRIADEQAAREANKAHRTAVKTAAKQAMMTCGADEETARKIVVAILAGEVPNVTLRF